MRKTPANLEIRSFAFELRSKKIADPDNDGDDDNEEDDEVEDEDEDEEDRSLTGYASVFDSSSSDLGGFNEIIQPGAFTRSLNAVAAGDLNVFALWSHDWSQPLGSTSGGKLSISQDKRGLAFNLDTTRMTPAQLDAAKDGELRMSFGFSVVHDEWVQNDDGTSTRTIIDCDLYEVSPVVLPAYPDTSAAVRSMNQWLETAKTNDETKYSSRAAKHRLLRKYLERKF